jgi:integrase
MPNIRKKSCERFLGVNELRALLSNASRREHVVLRILAVCGLRPAEILVLRIDDFEGAQLRIDEALKERQRGADRIGATKTAESDNYVPVPPDLAREFTEWITAHPDRNNPRALLFPNSAVVCSQNSHCRLKSEIYVPLRAPSSGGRHAMVQG